MNALDRALFLWLNLGAAAPHAWLEAARLASLQAPRALIAATLAVALLGRPAWRAQAVRMLLSVLLATAAAALLKRGFQFPRPFTLGLGTQWLPHGASTGFPSAHAASAMALAMSALLAGARRPVWLLALAVALLIGWSRIALGLHFPSDVLAGWCLGTLCALAVQRLAVPAAQRWPWLRTGLGG